MKLTPHLAAAGLVGALMVATPAVAQAASPPRAMPAHSSFTLSHADSSGDVSRQDRTFLAKVHQGNLAEITAGMLALPAARCEAVRHISGVLIEDHFQMDTKLRSVADRFHVGLPKAPSAERQKQLAKVATLSGRKFDIAWLRLQVSWHSEAIELVKQQLSHGRSPEVKVLANEAAKVIKRHLRLAHEAEEHC